MAEDQNQTPPPQNNPEQENTKTFMSRVKEQLSRAALSGLDAVGAVYGTGGDAALPFATATQAISVFVQGTEVVSTDRPGVRGQELTRIPNFDKMPDMRLSFTRINTGLGNQVDTALQKSQQETVQAITRTYNVLRDQIVTTQKAVVVADKNIRTVDTAQKKFETNTKAAIEEFQQELKRLKQSQGLTGTGKPAYGLEKKDLGVKRTAGSEFDLSDAVITGWLLKKFGRAALPALGFLLTGGVVGGIAALLGYGKNRKDKPKGWTGEYYIGPPPDTPQGKEYRDRVGESTDWGSLLFNRPPRPEFNQERTRDWERWLSPSYLLPNTGKLGTVPSPGPIKGVTGFFEDMKSVGGTVVQHMPGLSGLSKVPEVLGWLFGGSSAKAADSPVKVDSQKIEIEKPQLNLTGKESLLLKGAREVTLKAPKIVIDAAEIIFKGNVQGVEKPGALKSVTDRPPLTREAVRNKIYDVGGVLPEQLQTPKPKVLKDTPPAMSMAPWATPLRTYRDTGPTKELPMSKAPWAKPATTSMDRLRTSVDRYKETFPQKGAFGAYLKQKISRGRPLTDIDPEDPLATTQRDVQTLRQAIDRPGSTLTGVGAVGITESEGYWGLLSDVGSALLRGGPIGGAVTAGRAIGSYARSWYGGDGGGGGAGTPTEPVLTPEQEAIRKSFLESGSLSEEQFKQLGWDDKNLPEGIVKSIDPKTNAVTYKADVPEPTREELIKRASREVKQGTGDLKGGEALRKQIYDSFRNAGFSDNQAKALTAEVGRENSYRPELVFGSHSDPANAARNTGFFSWQKERSVELEKALKAQGLINPDGTIQRSQASLDVMAKFSKHEMETGQGMSKDQAKRVQEQFLNNPNVDPEAASRPLGKDYIRWRIDDPRYAHHRNIRKGHLDKITEITGREQFQQTGTPTEEQIAAAGKDYRREYLGSHFPEQSFKGQTKRPAGQGTGEVRVAGDFQAMKTHPAIAESMKEASKYLPEGYSIRFNNSARNSSTVGDSFHLKRDSEGYALATDISIIGPDGRAIPNIRSAENFGLYRDFMQNTKKIMTEKFPEQAGKGRWGGYFVGGVSQDLMHFDLGPEMQTRAGNWETGLKPEYAHFGRPEDVGKGMGPIAEYQLPELKQKEVQVTEAPKQVPLQERSIVEAGVRNLPDEVKPIEPSQKVVAAGMVPGLELPRLDALTGKTAVPELPPVEVEQTQVAKELPMSKAPWAEPSAMDKLKSSTKAYSETMEKPTPPGVDRLLPTQVPDAPKISPEDVTFKSAKGAELVEAAQKEKDITPPSKEATKSDDKQRKDTAPKKEPSSRKSEQRTGKDTANFSGTKNKQTSIDNHSVSSKQPSGGDRSFGGGGGGQSGPGCHFCDP